MVRRALTILVCCAYGGRALPLLATACCCGRTTVKHFRFMGQLIAKAFQDGRLLDLPLSPVVYRWLLGDEALLGLEDVHDVDVALARSLRALARLRDEAVAADAAPGLVRARAPPTLALPHASVWRH